MWTPYKTIVWFRENIDCATKILGMECDSMMSLSHLATCRRYKSKRRRAAALQSHLWRPTAYIAVQNAGRQQEALAYKIVIVPFYLFIETRIMGAISGYPVA
jgi:hypothetical protein